MTNTSSKNGMTTKASALILASGLFASAMGLSACTSALNTRESNPRDQQLRTDSVPLRPLTPYELSGVVNELLSDQAGELIRLQPGKIRGAAETVVTQEIRWSGSRSDLLEDSMYQIASRVVGNQTALKTCAEATSDTTCFATFVNDFLPRAFRRDVTSEEKAVFVNLANSLNGELGRKDAMSRALQAILLSPDFLYLTAFGDPSRALDTGFELTPFELASRLSFFLWAAGPDQELLNAARTDALRTDEQIEAQVRRMLANPKAGRGVARFALGWLDVLGLGSKTKGSPDWNPAIVNAALTETSTFVSEWFKGEESGFADLFTADHTYANTDLANFYGLTAPQGEGFQRIAGVGSKHRGGVLSQAAFLAAHAHDAAQSSTLRGHWVVLRALCDHIGAAPNGATDAAPKFTADMQLREWHEQIQANTCAAGCHNKMEPPGFAFEGFDSLGRVQTQERGRPIRTNSTLANHGDLNGSYNDERDFSAALGNSDTVRVCFARSWISYALGRPAAEPEVLLELDVASALEDDAQSAAVAIATSPSFRRVKR